MRNKDNPRLFVPCGIGCRRLLPNACCMLHINIIQVCPIPRYNVQTLDAAQQIVKQHKHTQGGNALRDATQIPEKHKHTEQELFITITHSQITIFMQISEFVDNKCRFAANRSFPTTMKQLCRHLQLVTETYEYIGQHMTKHYQLDIRY